MVVEEVPGAVARDLVEGFPRGALVGVGEQGFDPGRIEDLRLAGPAVAGGDAGVRAGGDLVPARAEEDDGIGGGRGGELGGDPVRRAASPLQVAGSTGPPTGRGARRRPWRRRIRKRPGPARGRPGAADRGETRTARGGGSGIAAGDGRRLRGVAVRTNAPSPQPAREQGRRRQRTAPADMKERLILK
ncbi:MAG: hypothetical protein M0C28_41850 [Candidatus Moduliflexus flocculans]|nr:hypothetical protein [Candidatus Moduliflexus flocculans]